MITYEVKLDHSWWPVWWRNLVNESNHSKRKLNDILVDFSLRYEYNNGPTIIGEEKDIFIMIMKYS